MVARTTTPACPRKVKAAVYVKDENGFHKNQININKCLNSRTPSKLPLQIDIFSWNLQW